MRSTADRYRDLFPAILTAREDRSVTQPDGRVEVVPFYGWIELTPSAQTEYAIQPGARSGTPSLNWARHLRDAMVPVGSPVWMRHRDEDGGALHFEFDSQVPFSVTPGGGSGSGSGSGSGGDCLRVTCCPVGTCMSSTLCLDVANQVGCECLEGRLPLVFNWATSSWQYHPPGTVCGVDVRVEVRCSDADDDVGEGYLLLDYRIGGTSVEGSPFTLTDCTLPWESDDLPVSGMACEGFIRLTLTDGACDGCDETIEGSGTLCVGPDITIVINGPVQFPTAIPVEVVTNVCPIFEDVDLSALGGATGPEGPAGPQGEQGPPGETGATGATGPAGPAGSDGSDGDPGSVWRTGSGAPSSGLGINGDFYLDTATGDVYQKAAGAYSVVANVTGPTGATGSAGADGDDGAPGPNLIDGNTTCLMTGYLFGDGTAVTAVPLIPWEHLDLATSDLADLATRSASDLDSGTLDAARLPLLNAFTDSEWALDDRLPFYDTSATANRDGLAAHLLGLARLEPGGRLTLTSGTPVTAADVTGATTLYYTPYRHDAACLWDGTRWLWGAFAETSLALGTVTSGLPYDVFGYLSSGTFTLEKLAWTNGTTRATAVTLQDGRYCKSGDKTRLYLGTFYTTSTTQTEDSRSKRFVWNNYNRRPRHLYVGDTTDSWSYSTNTWRIANANAANKVEMVRGLDEDAVRADVITTILASVNGAVGVGVSSTSVNSAQINNVVGANSGGGNSTQPVSAAYAGCPGLGYQYLAWLEIGNTGTITWYGDVGVTWVQTGLVAEVMA